MKIVKKIVIVILLNLVSFYYISNAKKIAAEQTNDEFIEISIYSEIDIFNVDLELYKAIPNVVEGEIVSFEDVFYEKINLDKNKTTIERPSEYFYLKIDLSTLPIGYGVDKRSYFIDKTKNKIELQILEIDEVIPEYIENNEVEVLFKSSDDKQLFVEYETELLKNNDGIDLKVTMNNNQEYTFNNFITNFNTDAEKSNDNVINYYGNSNYSILAPELSYMPVTYEVSNDGIFKVYYNPLTMTKDNVQKVIDGILAINESFCSANGFGFLQPKSNSDNEYNIYLEHNDYMNNIYGFTYVNTNNTQVYSNIVLNYGLLDKTLGASTDDDSFLLTLSHEYFHAIIDENSKGFNDSSDRTVFHESFASFAGLYYMNEISIDNSDIDTHTWYNYLDKVELFHQTTQYSLNDISFDEYRKYALFLLPLYIYQKYGISAIKDIINEIDDSVSILDSFNIALDKYGTDMDNLYLDFSIYNSFLQDKYDLLLDGYKDYWEREANIPTYSYEPYSFFQRPGHYYKELNLPFYSSTYRHFYNSDCSKYNVYITIEFNNASDLEIIQVLKNIDNEISNTPISVVGNMMTIPYYGFGSNECKELVFLFANCKEDGEDVNLKMDITFDHSTLSIEEGEIIDAKEHLHEPYNECLYEFIPNENNFYEFQFNIIYNNIQSNTPSQGIIKILDENKNVTISYQLITFSTPARNGIYSNNVIAQLEIGKKYFKDVRYTHVCDNLYVSVNKIENEISMPVSDEITLSNIYSGKSDFLYEITDFKTGRYKYQVNFSDLKAVTDVIFIFASIYKGELTILESKNININDTEFIFERPLVREYGHRYYIGFVSNRYDTKFDLSISRIIKSTFNLVTDLNQNVNVGTEVTMNRGDYQGTTITEGYTRLMYIKNGIPSNSRLDYYWYSLDETKARVSNYGTVTALETDEIVQVKIMAVYRYEITKVSMLELTILPDASTETKSVSLTTDKRVSGTPYGTEVSENNGEIGDVLIHKGYTRLICFEANSPTDSIQDFVWTSSDEEIATVSAYGTITARNKSGVVTITGVYKYNNTFIATIIIYVV